MVQTVQFQSRRAAAACGIALTLFGIAAARAQDAPAPNTFAPPPTAPALSTPTPVMPSPPVATKAPLSLSAQFAGDRKPIPSGVVWRVLVEAADGSSPRIIARSNEAAPTFELEPGVYLLHAAYGFASGTKRVTLGQRGLNERLSISAGGLSLAGSIGETPLPAGQLTFSVFVPLQGNSEGRLVTANAKAGDVIRLPEGTYHVVSTYGDSNAIQRADVKVEAGKITQATLHHRAAQVTLKLVAGPGGEAFAGTAFSVLTPGGDVIREAIGAFPQVILAEGDYVLIARQEGQVFSREFKVESGRDRDIEVIAK